MLKNLNQNQKLYINQLEMEWERDLHLNQQKNMLLLKNLEVEEREVDQKNQNPKEEKALAEKALQKEEKALAEKAHQKEERVLQKEERVLQKEERALQKEEKVLKVEEDQQVKENHKKEVCLINLQEQHLFLKEKEDVLLQKEKVSKLKLVKGLWNDKNLLVFPKLFVFL